jgi:Protein of unknown function (DUF3443)
VRRSIVVALLSALSVVSCGGGSSDLGSTSTTTPPTTNNVQSVTVDGGPAGIPSGTIDVNTLFTTVTVCVPNSSTCQTIDHVQVDTGSSGLRLLSSEAGGELTLTLPQQTDANNNPLAECAQFAIGVNWGPVVSADVKIAGEAAAAQAVQVIGASSYSTIPNGCSSSGTVQDTIASFGANGILGVGAFVSDCGPDCDEAGNTVYYSCPTATNCTSVGVAEASQVSNPVAAFTADNNGVIISLPAIPTAGSATLTGSLIFGIDTESNNALGSAQVFTISDSDGTLSTTYNGTTLTGSFIDSGSNAFYFDDTSIAQCPTGNNAPAAGFYCPTSTLSLSATIVGLNSVSDGVSFSLVNAQNLLMANPVSTASDIGAANVSTATFNGSLAFDWGLPFFYGRTVYTAIAGASTSGGMGPFIAF